MKYPMLTTPEFEYDGRLKRVEYEVLDLDRRLDSSEMTPGGGSFLGCRYWSSEGGTCVAWGTTG